MFVYMHEKRTKFNIYFFLISKLDEEFEKD